MTMFDRNEAILFRLLVGFFGEDRVIPHMSLQAACGGELPAGLPKEVSTEIERLSALSTAQWAKRNKCLFTIVNGIDAPCLVVEFFVDFASVVDVQELNRRRFMEPVLSAAGIPLVNMSVEDLDEIIDPDSAWGLADFLQSRLDLPIDLGQSA